MLPFIGRDRELNVLGRALRSVHDAVGSAKGNRAGVHGADQSGRLRAPATALEHILWHKNDLEGFIRRRAKGHPEPAAGISFSGYEWQTAEALTPARNRRRRRTRHR